MRRIRAGVIGVLGLANVAVACLIWLTGNNPLALGSWQRGAGALGNLAGLTAGSLLALQLLAMARIGPVERALGRDALAAGHRRLAIASMSCLAAHVALTAAERIAREPARIIPTVGGLFATRPWMLFATIGTAALVLVAATSARAARDRLRRESWHLLHLYSYLGAAMSFPHMVFGGADLHRAWARAYWWALYAAAFGSVLAWRLALPLWRSWRCRLRLAAIEPAAFGAATLVFHGRSVRAIGARGGHFFQWRLLGGPGWTRGHPYSLSAAPTDGEARITVKAVGDGSARDLRTPVGALALIEGPYGALPPASRREARAPAVYVGGGLGIAPLAALLEAADDAVTPPIVIVRCSDSGTQALLDRARRLAEARGGALHLLAGPRLRDGSWLPAGMGPEDGWERSDAEALARLVPDLGERMVYVCGPGGWVEAVRRAARRAGVRRSRLVSERFS